MSLVALSKALGVGTVLFGFAPLVAPRFFGRLLGINAASDPTVATAIRSVGARDLVIGVGLLRALQRQDSQAVSDWLLARFACDAGDTLGVSIAVAEGARSGSFVALGGLALGAAVVGGALRLRWRSPPDWAPARTHPV
ncbi:MAG: DUF4267 domain-containing protein [Chloroflexi bacterium]|nr:DUF4267 domain-containing protein [Chloroflexota bacterium]